MICMSPIAPTGETARGSPPLSMRITARIQCAGMPNLCDASATNAGKGRAERTAAERAIGADAAWAEPASAGAEYTKTSAAHIARRNEDERAGCARPGGATLCASAAQVSAAETACTAPESIGATATVLVDDGTITSPCRGVRSRAGSRGRRSRRQAAGRNTVRRARGRTAGS